MTETLPPPEAGPPAGERRRWPRHACRSAAALNYVPWPDSLGRLGHTLDVAPEGIGFRAERPLRPGAVLALQVLWGAPGASLTRVARVVYCAPRAGGGWRVGCQVSPPFSPEEVASLV